MLSYSLPTTTLQLPTLIIQHQTNWLLQAKFQGVAVGQSHHFLGNLRGVSDHWASGYEVYRIEEHHLKMFRGCVVIVKKVQSCLGFWIFVLLLLPSKGTSYGYKSPHLEIFRIFFRELSVLQLKISPQANALRTFLFLMFGQHLLNNSAADLFQFFTNCSDSLGSWLLPFLWGMHFVTNKFAL